MQLVKSFQAKCNKNEKLIDLKFMSTRGLVMRKFRIVLVDINIRTEV